MFKTTDLCKTRIGLGRHATTAWPMIVPSYNRSFQAEVEDGGTKI